MMPIILVISLKFLVLIRGCKLAGHKYPAAVALSVLMVSAVMMTATSGAQIATFRSSFRAATPWQAATIRSVAWAFTGLDSLAKGNEYRPDRNL